MSMSDSIMRNMLFDKEYLTEENVKVLSDEDLKKKLEMNKNLEEKYRYTTMIHVHFLFEDNIKIIEKEMERRKNTNVN